VKRLLLLLLCLMVVGCSHKPTWRNLNAKATAAGVTLKWTQGAVSAGSCPGGNGSNAVTNNKVYRSSTSGAETLLGSTGTAAISYTDTTATTPGATYYYKVTAVNCSGESGKSNEASATVPAAGTGPNCWVSPFNTWTDVPFAKQTSNFEIQFDVMPGASLLDATISLSTAPVTNLALVATTVSLNVGDGVQVYNGATSSYSSMANVKYSGGTSVHVTEDVNLAAHQVNVHTGTVLIASGYTFRPGAGTPASLGNIAVIQNAKGAAGSVGICNVAISAYPAATPR
jgi:hypothetical protein